MARPVTLGMINVLLKPQPLEERRRVLARRVAEAGESGCRIVLLPEFADHHVTREAFRAYKESPEALRKVAGLRLDSPWMRELADLARKYRMAVIPDVLLLDGERAFNSAVVFGPEGTVLGQYRKTHLAPGECKSVSPGERIAPIETPFGKIGLLICYDINFPELTRCHELQGAELLLWTTMRQGETEDLLYRAVLPARAYAHSLPLGVATYVTPNQIVTRKPMSGAIFNAFGQLVAGGTITPGVVCATVDLDERPLDRRYWDHAEWVDSSRYLRRRRRPDLYGPIVKPLSPKESDPEAEPTAGAFPEMTHPVL